MAGWEHDEKQELRTALALTNISEFTNEHFKHTPSRLCVDEERGGCKRSQNVAVVAGVKHRKLTDSALANHAHSSNHLFSHRPPFHPQNSTHRHHASYHILPNDLKHHHNHLKLRRIVPSSRPTPNLATSRRNPLHTPRKQDSRLQGRRIWPKS